MSALTSLARLSLGVVTCLALSIPPSGSLAAQGRGRGGPGGRGGFGQIKSPAATLKDNLEHNDPVAFLLDRKKPLALSGAQRDSLKFFKKEMRRQQEPLFKEMEGLATNRQEQAARGGRGRGGRSNGRGPDGGGGDGASGRGGDRGARAGASDTMRVLIDRLTDIQDAYGERARTQLSLSQRAKADTLMEQFLADERKRAEKAGPNRRP